MSRRKPNFPVIMSLVLLGLAANWAASRDYREARAFQAISWSSFSFLLRFSDWWWLLRKQLLLAKCYKDEMSN